MYHQHHFNLQYWHQIMAVSDTLMDTADSPTIDLHVNL